MNVTTLGTFSRGGSTVQYCCMVANHKYYTGIIMHTPGIQTLHTLSNECYYHGSLCIYNMHIALPVSPSIIHLYFNLK